MYSTIQIVTPSYNQGEFIGESIRSVISQEGDFFIDYVIVDGGSTDNSLEIIKKYDALIKEGKWPVQCRGIRYRWLSEKDNGQSAAINKGFHMAEGDIAAWLNSDDYYLPEAFAKAIRAFKNDGSIAMIYGEGDIVDKDGHGRKTFEVEQFFDLWKLIHLYDFILQPSTFMKYSALKKAGFLDENLHYIMDWELWIRLARFGRIRHAGEKFSCARVYPEAKTQASGMVRWREIRWCSKKYSTIKWPPVIFTQFFHKTLQLFKENKNRKSSITSTIVKSMTKTYYFCIGGNKSGISHDGYVEQTGFFSLPLRKEVAKVLMRLQAVCPNTIRYFINNKYTGNFHLENSPTVLELPLTDEMKECDFIHIKFVADRSIEVSAYPQEICKRKAAFKIVSVSFWNENGEELTEIGKPEFEDVKTHNSQFTN